MHKAIASAWAQDKKERKENLDKQIKKQIRDEKREYRLNQLEEINENGYKDNEIIFLSSNLYLLQQTIIC